MQRINWEVKYTSPPSALRFCKRCSAKTEFVSSGLFRINAQQKTLDVWLIYKCSHCDNTWNMTVLTRVSPKSIPAGELAGYHCNNAALAHKTALDATLIKQNGATPGLPEYEMHGNDIPHDMDIELHIAAEHSDIKVSSVLRSKLLLSRSAFDRMAESGQLFISAVDDIRKKKLGGEIIVFISAFA